MLVTNKLYLHPFLRVLFPNDEKKIQFAETIQSCEPPLFDEYNGFTDQILLHGQKVDEKFNVSWLEL